MLCSFDIAVIGAGPAGYTAALYAKRAGRRVCLISGPQPGGQLTTTSDVENWPGDRLVGGAELMVRMLEQVEALDVTMIDDVVTDCSTDEGNHCVRLHSGRVIRTSAVIVATGARAKWLGVPGETEYQNRGVSGCAICDGFFYRGKSVAVVGGGNTAVEEAIYLSAICQSVVLIHRRDDLRAEKILQQRLFEKTNVEFRWAATIEGFVGSDRLDGVKIKFKGRTETIPVSAAFVAIGHSPATKFLDGWIKVDASGYVVVSPGSTATTRNGVFAAGDAMDAKYRQAVTSAGAGCMAALDADRWLSTRPVSLSRQDIACSEPAF